MIQKKILILFAITLTAFLIACSGPSTSNEDNSLPQANIVDEATTLTIDELLELSGTQECSWNFDGSSEFAVSATFGNFMISNGDFYLENTNDGTTVYGLKTGEFVYLWNSFQAQNIGQKLNLERYEASVNNPIGHRAYFKMLGNIDYGITCNEVPSVTLPSVPSEIQFLGN